MISAALHSVFDLVGGMSREEVVARLTPIADAVPAWDEKRQRLVAQVSGLGLFRKIEMTFVGPGLRAVFFKVAWSCDFDGFVDFAEQLEAWLDEPAAAGLARKVEDARPRLEHKGSAAASMGVMVVMSDLPNGDHLSCSAVAFKPAGGQAYGFEVTWRPRALTAH